MKAKYCRGIGKAKGHGCGVETLFRKYGLCQKCYRDFLLNTEEGQAILNRSTLSAKKKVKREKAKESRKWKEEMTDYKPKLQDRINEIVRLIDWGQPCLARGYHPRQTHAGHVLSKGAFPSVRYNLHNEHRQSAQSNHFQNEDGLLREGLINEYGQDYMDFLNSMRGYPALKFSNEEYHQFYKKACDIALRLRKEGQVHSLSDRIELRNQINLEMGIYNEKSCIFKNTEQ